MSENVTTVLFGTPGRRVGWRSVQTRLPAIRELLRTPLGQKLFRYSMASVVAVICSTLLIITFDGIVGLSAVTSATLATAISAIPSYEMNRRWAWGKTGRSHLLKEVIPFWGLAFVGWGVSTLSVGVVERIAKHHHLSHLWTTATVTFVYVGAFGILWVVKFVIFNKVLFIHHHQEEPEPVGV